MKQILLLFTGYGIAAALIFGYFKYQEHLDRKEAIRIAGIYQRAAKANERVERNYLMALERIKLLMDTSGRFIINPEPDPYEKDKVYVDSSHTIFYYK
jgi:hypothetical protein